MHLAANHGSDTPSKAFAKLKTLFDSKELSRQAAPIYAHFKEVVEYAKRLQLETKIFISPLTSLRERFYRGGLIFVCLHDRKIKDVFASGGRYDELIRELRIAKVGGSSGGAGGKHDERHAVGFSIAWERLARVPKPQSKYHHKRPDEDRLITERRVSFQSSRLTQLCAMADSTCSAMCW